MEFAYWEPGPPGKISRQSGKDSKMIKVEDVQQYGKEHLESVVASATTVQNGVQAIALAHELHPDLVLMDINMPEMGGIEATKRIVENLPETFVVLCSTYEISDLPPDATTSGARAYVNKEQLGATTLRRLWDQRDEVAFAT